MSFDKIESIGAKEKNRQNKLKKRVFCCNSTACLSAGAGQVHTALEESLIKEESNENEAEIVKTGCMGLCSAGPLVRVEDRANETKLYGNVSTEIANEIISHHIFTNNAQSSTLAQNEISLEEPFFTKQVKVVLSQVGRIDPDKIEDYLANGGYKALRHVLTMMTPEEVCNEIKASGLRGRGGAGFPSGVKWNFVREQISDSKYVIVNGDEGDPGAYMDRTVMEDDPHRVLEGMMICAYAVGADFGYLYIRGEYPIAIERIRNAIRAARRHGIVGNSVLGTDFKFKAEVRIGAGAFVCGEETALIHSVEGKRGTPRIRPPYPSSSGLWGAPTVINNVETMANVSSIINQGAEWYSGIGTEKSKGTKVFALAGHLQHTGLIEVPMGITLKEIVFDIGGGIPGGREFVATQTGGPSGGCIPAEFIDTPVDYESLRELGSIMGSGGLVIIDDSTNMPEFAKFFMDFCVDESCGKCLPCRVGTVQISKLLEKLIKGEGNSEDFNKLTELSEVVKSTSLCGLGQSAPNPVLSTMKYFRHEYENLLQVNGDQNG